MIGKIPLLICRSLLGRGNQGREAKRLWGVSQFSVTPSNLVFVGVMTSTEISFVYSSCAKYSSIFEKHLHITFISTLFL